MILTKTFMLLCLSYRVVSDCGEPGVSRSAPLHPDTLSATQNYLEGHVVLYQCASTVAGFSRRTCKNGKWSNVIPKCPTKFNATNLEVVGSRGRIYVNWAEPEKVIGISIALRQVGEDRLYKFGVKGLWQPRIGWSGFEELPELGILIFSSGLSTSDIRNYKPIDQLLVLFTDDSINVDSCYNRSESNATYCLDDKYHSLFYIPEDYDNCDRPDAPLSASVISVPNGDGLIAEYNCKLGYRLKSDLDRMPTCNKHGDWLTDTIDPCEQVTCDPSEFIDKVRQFEPELSGGYAQPDTKAVLNCPPVSPKVMVTCLKSGQWTAIPEYCLNKEKSICFMLIVASICMAVVIVVLITVVWICVSRPVLIASRRSPSQAGSSTLQLLIATLMKNRTMTICRFCQTCRQDDCLT